MDELIKLCDKYKNVTKCEMKNLNLKIYTKNDFLNFSIYDISALFNCCLNNNLLIIKYFVKRYGITKDEIMICNKWNETCLHIACLYNQLLVIKYLINTYNLTKNDFMKKNVNNSNCLHYLFSYNENYKICLYIFNKYDFTTDDVLAVNNKGDLLYLCCMYRLYKSLKYLVSKYKFTENNLKRLETFSSNIKIKKILSINNLLNSKYNYNKMFNLIYKKN